MNVAKWADSHTLAISQPDGMEQVMEIDDESLDESEGEGDWFTSGLPPDNFAFSGNFSLIYYALPQNFSSIRQSQINLLSSFHELPLFILFNSYQGYLS